jgi:hypothetical protein
VVSVNDFFKCGIRIGLRLFENPQRKNNKVTRIKANRVLAFTGLVVCIFIFNKTKIPCAALLVIYPRFT